ncbi:cytochrome P450 1A1-like, partial [Sceloporus undulatus]|uniref:cytochrome P450 1A1-like n=1 Tax=Sceloporus undulatus TaxID=8520 RepID=UPI001C4B234B
MPALEMSPLEGLRMITATEAFIATAVFLSLFMMVKSFWNRIPEGLKKIPGPMGYPVIGNMLELGKNPHLSLTKMRKKYGDVMMIHIGTTPVLVLSGLETLRQALIRQGTEFMGRPDLYSFHYIVNGQSLAFGYDSGEVWRVRRKMAQNALKTFAASPS